MNLQEITIGVDEAGRGAFAGPLVAASVFITPAQKRWLVQQHITIRDSKTLSEPQRERVYESLIMKNITFQTEIIPVSDINNNGIGWANTTAIKTLIKRELSLLGCNPDYTLRVKYVVDGYFPAAKIAVEGKVVRCQVDADANVFPVILAGIVAKVTRDRIMTSIHAEFPAYNWIQNKGYGTREHIESIKRKGTTIHHRLKFVETALTPLPPVYIHG